MYGPYDYNFNNYNTPSSPPMNQYTFVNGIEGAKSFQIKPNQVIMLMDNDNPIVYKKTANSFGQSTLECFKLVPVTENELKPSSPEYATKEELNALMKRIEELTTKEVKDDVKSI